MPSAQTSTREVEEGDQNTELCRPAAQPCTHSLLFSFTGGTLCLQNLSWPAQNHLNGQLGVLLHNLLTLDDLLLKIVLTFPGCLKTVYVQAPQSRGIRQDGAGPSLSGCIMAERLSGIFSRPEWAAQCWRGC